MDSTTSFVTARVVEKREVSAGYVLLRLDGCRGLEGTVAGQFAMLRGSWGRDPVLPRAYSILDVDGAIASFLVKQVGRGSRLLGSAVRGDQISVLGPLGNGFPAHRGAGQRDLLVAGGCGLPPVHLAASRAAASGHPDAVELLLGARTAAELPGPLLDQLRRGDVSVSIITEDGTEGERGLVTDLLEQRLAHGHRVLACGPTPMLRAVREVTRRRGVPCYLSLEAEMACGLGACLGCAVTARDPETGARLERYVHVCSDGPVFDAEEVWP